MKIFLTHEAEKGRQRSKRSGLLATVDNAIGQLADNPRHTGLRTHTWNVGTGPAGEQLWQSRVNRDWRLHWFYGPDSGEITIVRIGPHPKT